MKLRDYQLKCVNDVYKSLKKHRTCLLIAPTGSGKTAMSTYMVGDALKKSRRVFFIVHRDELVHQTKNALKSSGVNEHCSVLKAGHPAPSIDAKLIIASAQTMARRKDGKPKEGDIVFVDECHLVAYHKAAKEAVEMATKVIGLTATPWRLKKTEGLSSMFESYVLAPLPSELRDMGFLSPARIYGFPAIDVKDISTTGGDYNLGDLEKECLSKNAIDCITENVKEIMPPKSRTAIAFCSTVSHAKYLSRQLAKYGYKTDHVVGGTTKEERSIKYEMLRKRELDILCSVGVLTEGFDVPEVDGCLLCRPTQSKALNTQMIGRALRISPGKKDALIIDFAGNCSRHGLPYDITKEDMMPDKPGRANKGDAPVKNCPECSAIVPAQSLECVECGHIFERRDQKKKSSISGKVEELSRKDAWRENQAKLTASVYCAAVVNAIAKNYKLGKAAYDYKMQVGYWPSKMVKIHIAKAIKRDKFEGWVRSVLDDTMIADRTLKDHGYELEQK